MVSSCSQKPAASPASSSPRSPTATPRSPMSSAAASPPPAPMTTIAPAVSPASGVLLCRDAWGARPPRSGGTPQVPSRLTIHHSAVVLGNNSNAPGRIREDQRYHQDTQGWIDIAYHVGVDRNGNIYELRNAELVGDTATTYDPTGHFLVLCEGDFDKEEVTERTSQRNRSRMRLGRSTLRHSDRDAGWPPGFRGDLLPGREPLCPRRVRRSQAPRRGPRRRRPRRSAAVLWARGHRHRRGYRGWPSLADVGSQPAIACSSAARS